jgi:lysophospholipase L1-like esterase
MSTRAVLENISHWIGVLWAQVGLLIFFLFALNFAAGLVVKEARHFHKTHQTGPQDAYYRAPWTAEHFMALWRLSMKWAPYVYWKSASVSSPYLNVDQQGNRATWNKPYQGNHRGRPITVFTFGGSTMFGYGVRDDYTVASLLSKRLAEKTDYNVEVFNYGQIGYVSTQELLLLFQLLRLGLRPNLVIFFDGINDTYSAYQSGIAGIPWNESFRVREFNLISASNRAHRLRLYRNALDVFLHHTNIARLGLLIGSETDSAEEPDDSAEARNVLKYLAPSPSNQEPDFLEQQVVSVYLFNKQVVEMLGKRFGFRSLFYWQPVIYSKNILSPFERKYRGGPELKNFFHVTYGLAAAAMLSDGVRDISGVFNNDPHTYLMDGWHPTESGNELIAEGIAGDVEKILPEIDRGRGTNPAPMGAAPLPSR